eukprot:12926952-Prorocentrum_lima.AAC.1
MPDAETAPVLASPPRPIRKAGLAKISTAFRARPSVASAALRPSVVLPEQEDDVRQTPRQRRFIAHDI